MKSVQIWSFLWSIIQSKYGKIRTRKNSISGHFSHSDSSTLGDNLILIHQVDYMFSAFIQAEAVENDQEHLVVIGYSYYRVIS